MSARRLGQKLNARRSIEVRCRVEVSHRFESLGAHVDLEEGVDIRPGDRVRVQGEPIRVPYGETIVEQRVATILRAPWWERWWLRATGDLDYRELIDVSFTDRRNP